MTSRHNRRARHKRHKALTLARKHAHKATAALSERLHDLEIDEDAYRHKLASLLARPSLQGKVGATGDTRHILVTDVDRILARISAAQEQPEWHLPKAPPTELHPALQALLDNSFWSNDGVHWSNRP